MQSNGEESPLDILPKLDGFEDSIHRTYSKFTQLKSGEFYISAIDYNATFKLLGIKETKQMLLSMLMKIDSQAVGFRYEFDKNKNKSENVIKKK